MKLLNNSSKKPLNKEATLDVSVSLSELLAIAALSYMYEGGNDFPDSTFPRIVHKVIEVLKVSGYDEDEIYSLCARDGKLHTPVGNSEQRYLH